MGTVHDLVTVRDLRECSWFWVERRALRHVLALVASGRLLSTDLIVYMFLCSVEDEPDYIPTQAALARRLGRARRTIGRSLHRLERAALVRRVSQREGGAYRVLWAPQEP